MQRALDVFKQKIKSGSTALFFFSGYGLQVGRQSYLIPVNAQIWTENDIRRDGFSIESILTDHQQPRRPGEAGDPGRLAAQPVRAPLPRAPAGLASIDAPDGTLIMSAAAPGKVINEAEGENSMFIGELVKELRSPGLTAEEIFSRTRIGVSRVSNGEQVPYVASSLIEDFYFVQPPGRASPPAVDARPPPRQPEPRQPEARAQPEPRQPAATRSAAAAHTAAQAQPQPQPQPQRRGRNAATGRARHAAAPSPATCSATAASVPRWWWCRPARSTWARTTSTFEKPSTACDRAAFAIGRREISSTNGISASRRAAASTVPDDRGQGRGERPIIDVSWRDAKAYVDWLSQKTGQKYRLPSEAEWEYAARGGTKTTFWWGRDVGERFANCRDCGACRPAPVASGSTRANPFGLFDTAGNAAEWVEDCWNDSYRNAPARRVGLDQSDNVGSACCAAARSTARRAICARRRVSATMPTFATMRTASASCGTCHSAPRNRVQSPQRALIHGRLLSLFANAAR